MTEVNHPKRLVELYRAFYRADKQYDPTARKAVQPVAEGIEIIIEADPSFRNPDTLTDAVAGRLGRLMAQIHTSTGALGRWVIEDSAQEREAILAFASYLVKDVFYGAFQGRLDLFHGRQADLLRNTCELIYRQIQDKENREYGEQ